MNKKRAVDIRDLSIIDIFKAFVRLKISATIWLVGLLVSAFSISFYAGKKMGIEQAAIALSDENKVFQERYIAKFLSNESLQPLLKSLTKEQFDGLESEYEYLMSLLWQLKSQKGYAEFLSGNKSKSVTVTYEDNHFKFDWQDRENIITDILENLGITYTEEELMQYNAEMNLFGVTWFPTGDHIARDFDGGINVVSTSNQ